MAEALSAVVFIEIALRLNVLSADELPSIGAGFDEFGVVGLVGLRGPLVGEFEFFEGVEGLLEI